jgi:hypothetical protein
MNGETESESGLDACSLFKCPRAIERGAQSLKLRVTRTLVGTVHSRPFADQNRKNEI